jgi:prepilin-type N-terminal cleavage/methylation domain-containing protein
MKREHGFTLIELLVVVAIVGVLAAIAIPQFSSYRQRAFDARAKSDIHSLAVGEEAYFVDSEVYKSCTLATCASLLPGLKVSAGVNLGATAATTFFTATANHSKGAGITFNWNSTNGGLQ